MTHRNYLVTICLITGTLCAMSPARAEEYKPPFDVKTKIVQPGAFIGDSVTIHLEARARRDMELQIAKLPEGDGQEVVVVSEKITRRKGWLAYVLRLDLVIKSFETGRLVLSGPVIRYKQEGADEWLEFEAEPIAIEIKSLLEPGEDKKTIRDIKGPWTPPDKRPWILAAVLLAAGLYLMIRRRMRSAKPKGIAPRRSAHEIALDHLRQLIKKDLISRGFVKDFIYELSLIVRHYLEDRFNVHAPEMTTEEFNIFLKDSGILDESKKSILKQFLVSCDRVKFARYEPQGAEIDDMISSAKKLIEDTAVVAAADAQDGTKAPL